MSNIYYGHARTVFSKKGASLGGYIDYVYIRTDPDPVGVDPADPRRRQASDLAVTRAALNAARKDGFHPHRRDAVTEKIGAAVAVSGRPKLMQLLRKMDAHATLIVRSLDGLGRDAADILKTIRFIKERDAYVHCIDVSGNELSENVLVIRMLEAMARLDRQRVAEQAHAKGEGRGVVGGRLGRPRSLDEGTRAAVRAELKAGETISALARRYNTSRQTILRVREAKR